MKVKYEENFPISLIDGTNEEFQARLGWECEVCPYACEDHSLGNKFGIDYTNRWGPSTPCVCLKDYYEKGYGDRDRR